MVPSAMTITMLMQVAKIRMSDRLLTKLRMLMVISGGKSWPMPQANAMTAAKSSAVMRLRQAAVIGGRDGNIVFEMVKAR